MTAQLPSAEATDIRRRILGAAIPLFANRGYGSTSVRELAEAAGVTKPTLYYHFGNKEGLFVAAVEAVLEVAGGVTREAVAMPGTLRERLQYFIEAHFEHARAFPDAFRLVLTAEYPAEGQPKVDLMSAHQRHGEILFELFQNLPEGTLRPGVSPESAVLALMGMVGTACQACVYGFNLPDDLPQQLTEIFFSGVGQ
jgi:TetR/AcrR family transcriptional regulator